MTVIFRFSDKNALKVNYQKLKKYNHHMYNLRFSLSYHFYRRNVLFTKYSGIMVKNADHFGIQHTEIKKKQLSKV